MRHGHLHQETEAKLPVLSASQIEEWKLCQRKWAWKHVAKIKPPPHKSAALGTNTHSQLETYLEGGELDFLNHREAADIAASGLHHLPAPKTEGLELEKHFKIEINGITYQGYIDALLPPPPRPKVYDHKTTSDLQRAKTPADLLTDTQAILYAQNAFIRWPKADAVDLQWTYFQTRKTRKSLPVIQTVTRDHVSQVFPQIEEGAREILHTLERKTQPLDLPLPTGADACRAFGGCPYQAQCNLSPAEMVRAMAGTNEGTPSFLKGLLNKTTETVPTQPSETLPPPAQPAPELPPWATASKDPGVQKVNPPESELKVESVKDLQTKAPADTIPAPPPVVEEKAKRTRKTKAETVEVPEPAPSKTGFTLYVDCFPIGSRARTFETLVARAQAEIKATAGVEDYRMVDFGKGAAILSQLVASYAGDEDLVIDTRTPEGSVCKTALAAKAALVVMGVR